MAKKEPIAINDLQQADAVLVEIAALNRQVTAIEADLNAAIDDLKQDAAEEAEPFNARIKELGAGLKAFAGYHKSELFADKKTLDLTHGHIGYRKTTTLKTQPKHTWQMVLGRLKDLSLVAGIRTKEEVNKDELNTWPKERLELIGAYRAETDEFWYEISTEDLLP